MYHLHASSCISALHKLCLTRCGSVLKLVELAEVPTLPGGRSHAASVRVTNAVHTALL